MATDIQDHRLRRLAELVELAGTIAAFVRGLRPDDDGTLPNESYISALLNRHRSFGEKAARKLALRAGLPADYFDQKEREELPLGVPVLGYVRGGRDGYYVETEEPVGGGAGFVRYPMRDPNTYALRVRGDSMRPRVKPGEFIVVEPNHSYAIGDDVMVKMVDEQGVERAMVKVLSRHSSGEYEFRSINESEHPPITVEEKNVKAIHYIGAIAKPSWYYERT